VLLVPLLTLAFGYSLTSAVGTSLVCVIATAAGAAAHNVRTGRADARLGIVLAAGTVVGAFTGGFVAGYLPDRLLAGLFALLMVYTAYSLSRGLARRSGDDGGLAEPVDPSARDGAEAPAYRQRRRGLALSGSFLAGNVSGLLGVGGGVITVPLVHLLMRAPLHVAAATSNFMIGMTATAGAFAYLLRGDVDPSIAGPVVLGVAAGSFLGARVAPRINASWLTALFLIVVLYVAFEMAMRAIGAAR
jgi:uncharacterized membrane protein YfcA